VINLHTCPCTKIKLKLKYRLKGDIISMAHAAVVRNADVMYIRDITGISVYLFSLLDVFVLSIIKLTMISGRSHLLDLLLLGPLCLQLCLIIFSFSTSFLKK